MPRFQIQAAQLGLLSGVRQPKSELITTFEPASAFAPESRKGPLFIVTEAAQERLRGRDACLLAASTVRKAFYADRSSSVTSSLRAALHLANKAVHRHNFDAPPHKRASVGISCAVLREQDLYIAQVQPAQAFVLSEGRLRALPAGPAWDSSIAAPSALMQPNALGSSLFAEPEFFRCNIQPGERFLICSTKLAQILGRATVDELLRFRDAQQAADQLHELCRRNSLAEAHALIVELLPVTAPATQSSTSPPIAAALRRGNPPQQNWIERLLGAVPLPTRRSRSREGPPERGASIPASWNDPAPATPPPPPMPTPIELGESLQQRVEQARATALPPADPLPPSALLGESGYEILPPVERRIDLGDVQQPPARSARPYQPEATVPAFELSPGERFGLPLRRVGNLLNRSMRPRPRRVPAPPMPQMRPQGLSYRRQTTPPFSFTGLLLLVVLVGALIGFGYYQSRENDRQSIADELLVAEQTIAQLSEAPSDQAARALLEEAGQQIARIRSSPLITVSNPLAWTRYQELERAYSLAQSELQRLSNFDDLMLLASHPATQGRFASLVVPPPASVVTPTTAYDFCYALDQQSGAIYRIPIEGGQPELFLAASTVAQNPLAGPIQAQAWREDNLVALDQGQAASSYYFRVGETWGFSRLEGSDTWVRGIPRDIEIYDTNLYILDQALGQILKYTSGFYSSFPDAWIRDSGGRDIGNSLDMAIDGQIYLLQPDGRVFVYALGAFSREIVPTGIDPPLAAAQSFFVTGDAGSGFVFIVDTQGERILQIDKQSGELIQQIKAPLDGEFNLNQLRSVYVDTSGSRPTLYLVNGGQILRASLPTSPVKRTP